MPYFIGKKDKSQCLLVCLDAKSSMKVFWVSNHVGKKGLEFEKFDLIFSFKLIKVCFGLENKVKEVF